MEIIVAFLAIGVMWTMAIKETKKPDPKKTPEEELTDAFRKYFEHKGSIDDDKNKDDKEPRGAQKG